jgi:hypothetical protein
VCATWCERHSTRVEWRIPDEEVQPQRVSDHHDARICMRTYVCIAMTISSSHASARDVCRFPYEGILCSDDEYELLSKEFYINTAVDMTTLDYVYPPYAKKTAVILIGNPMCIGPSMNSYEYGAARSARNMCRARMHQDKITIPAKAINLQKANAKEGTHKIVMPASTINMHVDSGRQYFDELTEKQLEWTEVLTAYESSGEQGFFIKPSIQQIYCDVCFKLVSHASNPIVRCQSVDSMCISGRHVSCFREPRSGSSQHFCGWHAPVVVYGHTSTDSRMRMRKCAASFTSLPVHNLPHRDDAEPRGPQELHHTAYTHTQNQQHWFEHHNTLLGVQVKTSLIPKSGQGLFSIHAVPAGSVDKLLGYFHGRIISATRYDALVEGRADVENNEEDEFLEDYKNGIKCALDISDTISGSNDTFVLLIDRRCPMRYMNDPNLPSTSYCTLVRPKEYAVVKGDPSAMSCMTFPVYFPRAGVVAGGELYFNYHLSLAEIKQQARTRTNVAASPVLEKADDSDDEEAEVMYRDEDYVEYEQRMDIVHEHDSTAGAIITAAALVVNDMEDDDENVLRDEDYEEYDQRKHAEDVTSIPTPLDASEQHDLLDTTRYIPCEVAASSAGCSAAEPIVVHDADTTDVHIPSAPIEVEDLVDDEMDVDDDVMRDVDYAEHDAAEISVYDDDDDEFLPDPTFHDEIADPQEAVDVPTSIRQASILVEDDDTDEEGYSSDVRFQRENERDMNSSEMRRLRIEAKKRKKDKRTCREKGEVVSSSSDEDDKDGEKARQQDNARQRAE